MSEQKLQVKSITKEVIDVLIYLTRGVIGTNVGSVILRDLKIENESDGREIFYKFASSIEETLGKNGAFATLKQVGRDFGYAQKVEKEENNAFICNCVFYDVIKKEGLEPLEHPVCWTGWGFLEGFMQEFEEVQRIK